MRQVILALAFLLTAQVSFAQGVYEVTVRDRETKEPVAGATVTVKGTEITATTDARGVAGLAGVPGGAQTLEVFSAGYGTTELRVTLAPDAPGGTVVFIKVTNELGEVTVVETTRTGREIDDTPTRVEAVDEEEIGEKMSMRPANVSMVLSESTGIKVQQTSATTQTQSVRIQGLDGRYTQLLKDGFPAFGGFSGSLGLLDIPPLDLKQVEIVKGPAATFYGGGAIAGVVNFISRVPGDEPVTNLIFNVTSAGGVDLSVFDSRRLGRHGYTLLGSVNYQREYDVDDDDFTELPRARSFNLAPRFFFQLDDETRLTVGNSTSVQRREGGDVFVIRDAADAVHQYFERNDSARNITTVQLDRDLTGGRKVVARQSLAFFGREIEIPGYRFEGRQFNSYTDLSYFHPVKSHALVFGLNAAYDRFREGRGVVGGPAPRDESRRTFGGYAQDSFNVTEKLSLEAGFRLDHVRDYGAFALPRVSALYKFNERLSSRFTVGFGYKTPSIFTEEAETLLFRGVLPVGNTLKAERSRGGTFDVNYRGTRGEKFAYSLNQMFFYTRITDPLVLSPRAAGLYGFENAPRPVTSRGFETNARLSYDIVKLFAGYTYTNARAGYLTGNQILALTPRSRVNSALLFEREDDFKAGVEAYYTSSQYLTDRFRTRPFWVAGVFGEKSFGKYSLFFNAENVTDTRQGRFGAVVFPPHANPTFAEIYTHTEGRVFNGGVKVRL
ncbi:MAG TPA: TonB-dependent receptor [Pyrinomonadaceae bacterium]|jgi:iron complex outermembrane receptor protein/outer membrane receptor for ferrienterochelin and colicins